MLAVASPHRPPCCAVLTAIAVLAAPSQVSAEPDDSGSPSGQGEARAPHPCVRYAPPPIDAAALEEVRRTGQQVSVETKRSRGAPPLVELRTLLYVPEPPWLAWTVVRDYEAWCKFLPRMTESAVLRDDGTTADVRTRIDLPWPLPVLGSVTRSVHDRCGEDRWLVRWVRLSGKLTDNRGWSWVEPAPGGGTLVRQRIALAADLPLSAEVVGAAARRYFRYVVTSFGEQIMRANEHGWYEQRRPPTPALEEPGATGSGPPPSAARP